MQTCDPGTREVKQEEPLKGTLGCRGVSQASGQSAVKLGQGLCKQDRGISQQPSKFLGHQMRNSGSPTLLEDFMCAGREMAVKESNISR